MYLFKEYLARRLFEASLPVPPGVDPEMWANASYQRFWLAQNPNYAAQFQQAQQPAAAPPPVARHLGIGSGLRSVANNPLAPAPAPEMDINQIENALASFLKSTNSIQASLKELKKVNPTLAQVINQKLGKGIPLHDNGGRATRQGRGIHFYKNLNGDTMFKQVTGNPF
jgi:hypothetical protein